MAVIFEDNFDGEVEGTSPPANWINRAATNCEVDDVQSHSGSYSMWLFDATAHGYAAHELVSGLTDERITIWIYFENINKNRQIYTQATLGTLVAAQMMVRLYFRPDGTIQWYDGTYHDSGYTYTTGWHKIEIVQDVPNDQYDVWYDDVKVLKNALMANVGKTVWWQVVINAFASQLWADDIQIGTSGWTGIVAGVDNPAKVAEVSVENIALVQGVA